MGQRFQEICQMSRIFSLELRLPQTTIENIKIKCEKKRCNLTFGYDISAILKVLSTVLSRTAVMDSRFPNTEVVPVFGEFFSFFSGVKYRYTILNPVTNCSTHHKNKIRNESNDIVYVHKREKILQYCQPYVYRYCKKKLKFLGKQKNIKINFKNDCQNFKQKSQTVPSIQKKKSKIIIFWNL